MENARALCLTQLNYLDTLTAAKRQEKAPVQQAAPAQQPEVHETIRSIDDSVAQITEDAPEIDIAPAMESNQPATDDAADEATQLYNFLHNS